MRSTTAVTIKASAAVVWSVWTDVERWSEWTASVTSVELLDGPLAVGARARIRQPRLPAVVWTVTELDPGRSWTWESRAPGMVSRAVHEVRGDGSDGSIVAEAAVEQGGPLGAVMGRLLRRLTRRYMDLEAAGLKRRSEADAAASAPG